MACPVHTDAGRYVTLIAEGRFEEAYRVARGPNPLASVCGRVCTRPCETACRRGQIDKPVAIRALKRFLTERHGPESRHPVETLKSATRLPFKVAIMGSGPVGLSAAHDLALMGYSLTIFEAAPVAGGMLHLGIPKYRLPRETVEAQVREILGAGDIALKLNCVAGRDFTLGELRQQGFDAVLLAVGAHHSRDLNIPGAELDGVHRGIDFLRSVNLGYRLEIGTRVVVIGGGNVAMDVARTTLREVLRAHRVNGDGTPCIRGSTLEVNIVCLEPRHEMPATPDEIEEAEREGIIIHAGFGPKRVLGQRDRVIGLETLDTQRVFDPYGRFRPTFREGSERVVECDTIIIAIGQTPNLEFLRPEDGVQISPRGLVVVDPGNLMTSAPGIFAGGDCAFAPRHFIHSPGGNRGTVDESDEYLRLQNGEESKIEDEDFSFIVDGISDGKRAALGIDEYLRGPQRSEARIEIETLSPYGMAEAVTLSRPPAHRTPIERRPGAAQVEIAYDEQSAIEEARRCLRCRIRMVFEGAPDRTECTLCGGCVDVCPEDCLTLMPLERVEFEPDLQAQLHHDLRLNGLELKTNSAEASGQSRGTAMIKDESRCIRCGLCALRCPVGSITLKAYNLVSCESAGVVPIRFFDPTFEAGLQEE